ncbi:MAG: ATP-grasp domain-containing protein [Candidatus Nitrospinota bacterium M3_3B_026]
MPDSFNILITAASRRVAMIRGFARALRGLGLRGQVQVCDTDELSPGLRFCDKSHIVPLSSSPDYIPAIMEICRREGIRLVVPTIDEELPILGRSKDGFEAIGVTVLVSDERTGIICNDKYLTARFFEENDFPFAETTLPGEVNFDSIEYPLFIKPRTGRGSIKAFPVRDERELRFFMDYVEDPVIQRYLEGVEYTIDALAGLDGRILSIVPRERIVIRSGVCDRGRTRRDPKLIALSRAILEKLGVVGPVNLQLKMRDGEAVFFEINPRFSGAIQLTVAAGADFFTTILREVLGEAPEPAIGDFKDGLLMMSYEESIFEENGLRRLPCVDAAALGAEEEAPARPRVVKAAGKRP